MMLIFTDSVYAACSVAISFGGLSFRGAIARRQDLDANFREISEEVKTRGFLSCNVADISSRIIYNEADLVRPAPDEMYEEGADGMRYFRPGKLLFEAIPGMEEQAASRVKMIQEGGYDRICHVSTGHESDRRFLLLCAYADTAKRIVRVCPDSLSDDDIRKSFERIADQEIASMCWQKAEMTRMLLYYTAEKNLSRYVEYFTKMHVTARTKPIAVLLGLKGDVDKEQVVLRLTEDDTALGVPFSTQSEVKEILSFLISSGYLLDTEDRLILTEDGKNLKERLLAIRYPITMDTVLRFEKRLYRIANAASPDAAHDLSKGLLDQVQQMIEVWRDYVSGDGNRTARAICPACGAVMVETQTNITCEKCGCVLSKRQFGRMMSGAELAYLCQEGKTPFLSGFIPEGKKDKEWRRLVLRAKNNGRNVDVVLTSESDYVCPYCGKHLCITPNGKALACYSPCGFTMPTAAYGHKLQRDEINALLSNGETPLISDFTIHGTEFTGFLELTETHKVRVVAVQ